MFIALILVMVSWVPTPAAAAAKSLQSCLTLCDPRDGSPPGSPIPGILQASELGGRGWGGGAWCLVSIGLDAADRVMSG